MVNKAELIDLNQRIKNFEHLAHEFAEIFSEDIDNAKEIDHFVEKMEHLREKLDHDLAEHDLSAVKEDVKNLDKLDRMIDQVLIEDLKSEAKAIDKELRDIVKQAEG